MINTKKKNSLQDDYRTYDATSIIELQSLLRKRLKDIQDKKVKGSLRAIGSQINVSHTYLGKFRDGDNVCMNIMNRLANHFGYRYYLENYDEDELT